MIARVSELERQLNAKNAEYQLPTNTAGAQKHMAQLRAFNPSKYSTRFIALKFAYLGQNYNGYECANGNTTPLPTIEEVLWKALRKGRLIAPLSDEPIEVQWDAKLRMQTPIVLNWEGCQYSKCGRTDRGVSAFGQVIGIRVRSNRPLNKSEPELKIDRPGTGGQELPTPDDVENADDELPGLGPESDVGEEEPFDPIKDELPYLSILNSILPQDIRALAWCADPPQNFDARFSCGQRRYRYFFTNPAFLPTPGPSGLKDQNGQDLPHRNGYLDIAAMQEACSYFVGLHDFRNFCKIDESKQMPNCERRVLHAVINDVSQSDGPHFVGKTPELAPNPGVSNVPFATGDGSQAIANGPKVYCFEVHGTAFLWHQIRCMVAILFLIGQGLEKPSLVKELLDIQRTPGRPMYEMASDAPLVLWDCIFPETDRDSPEDAIDWIYAGDARALEAVNTKSDGKYGLMGTVDQVWNIWRKCKIQEVLAAGLLDLAAGQGDRSSLERGGLRFPNDSQRSQKIFDGSDFGRLVGKYTPVMQKQKMESLEVQNARYRAGKGSRKVLRKKTDVTNVE